MISEKKNYSKWLLNTDLCTSLVRYRLRIKEKKNEFEHEGTTNKSYSSVNSFIFSSNTGIVILKVFYV